MNAFLNDLRIALRTLRRSPGFAASGILVLAVGLSATTIAYALIDSILLRPLPYAQPEQLVQARFLRMFEGSTSETTRQSLSVLDAWARSRTVRGVAGAQDGRRESIFFLSGVAEPARLIGARVTPNYFAVLGATALLGRTIAPSDAGERVVVLSENVWRRRFGADRALVGTTLRFNGEPYTVIGVLPRSFEVPRPPTSVAVTDAIEIWAPIMANARDVDRVIVRLAGGIADAEAEAELERLRAEAGPPEPGPPGMKTAVALDRLTGLMLDPARHSFTLLAGVVALTLLLACVSIAGLLFARFAARSREAAVRAALGAPPARLFQHFITEALVLAVFGGALGIVLSYWGLEVVRAAIPAQLPRLASVTIDGSAVLLTLGLTMFAGLVIGGIPAALLARGARPTLLRSGHGVTAGRGMTNARAALVALQLAIALTLTSSALILVHSLLRLNAVELGFDPRGVIVADVYRPPRLTGSAERPQHAMVQAELLERVRDLPGITAAGLTSSVPLRPRDYYAPEWRERVVDAGYFDVVRTQILAGRNFQPTDGVGAARVAIIDETLAALKFAGRNPVGQTLDEYLVIGVARSTRHLSHETAPQPALYRYYAQSNEDRMSLVIRTERTAASLIPAIRSIILAVDPDQPVANVATLVDIVGRSEAMAKRQFNTRVLLALGSFAVLLATLGVYAVASQLIVDRRRELAVRVALGATSSQLRAVIVRRAAQLTGLGLLGGALGVLAISRTLRSSLFEVGPADPFALAGAAALLGLAVIAAMAQPLRRAARLDPIEVLKAE